MLEHGTRRLIAAHAGTTVGDVLEQVRAAKGAPVVIALDALSLIFATPDHFRALETARAGKPNDIVFATDDPHRTGLALAFGYRVQPLASVTTQREPTRPVVTRIGAGTRSLGVEAPPQPPQPKPTRIEAKPTVPTRIRRTPRQRRVKRAWLWGAGLGLLILTLLCGAATPLLVMRVHRATIDLYPAEEPFSRIVPFAVSADTTAKPDPGILPAHPFNTTLVRETDVPATGTKNVPDGTASGTMTLRSRADGALTVKAGTSLRGPKDVSYIVQADVIVPGLDFVKGQLGEATAKVRADTPGPAGNLPAGYTAKFTENITFIGGEISGGTEKQVTVIAEDDVARGRQELEDKIRNSALADVNANLPAGVTPLNDFLTKQPPTVTSTPAVGEAAASVHVRMTVAVQVPVYENSVLQELVRNRAASTVAEIGQSGGGHKEVVPNSVTTAPPTQLGVEGKQVRFQTEVRGTLRSVITADDATRIGRGVAGKTSAEADTAVRAEPGVGRFTIVYGPSWLPPGLRDRMPKRASNVAVRIMAPA